MSTSSQLNPEGEKYKYERYFGNIIKNSWGTWVAQSVEHLTSAQIMISWSGSLSPAWGSVLTAQSLEPALDSVSPSLFAPPLLMLCLSLSQKYIKTLKKKKKRIRPEKLWF